MTAIIIFFIIHWYASLFFQTFFLHRYAAHGMFSMSKAWERFFYVLTFIGQGSSYLSPYAYGVMHRMHHAFADTEDDPHSPSFDPNLFAMMWRTRLIYNGIYNDNVRVEKKFTIGVPNWRSFDLFAANIFTRLAWSLLYVAFYLVFAPHWAFFLLIPVHIAMGPVHGVIINWFTHKYGYTNFKVNDTSKNLIPIDLLMLGEALHNNHHTRGNNPNFGYKWFEFDPVYPIIQLLDAMKVIKLKPVPVVVQAQPSSVKER